MAHYLALGWGLIEIFDSRGYHMLKLSPKNGKKMSFSEISGSNFQLVCHKNF